MAQVPGFVSEPSTHEGCAEGAAWLVYQLASPKVREHNYWVALNFRAARSFVRRLQDKQLICSSFPKCEEEREEAEMRIGYCKTFIHVRIKNELIAIETSKQQSAAL